MDAKELLDPLKRLRFAIDLPNDVIQAMSEGAVLKVGFTNARGEIFDTPLTLHWSDGRLTEWPDVLESLRPEPNEQAAS